jgi:hypothetical protein
VKIRTVSSVFSNIFSLEMRKGGIEFPNAEIAVNKVNCASSRTLEIAIDQGFIFIARVTLFGDVFFGNPTLVSSAFHPNTDEIDFV